MDWMSVLAVLVFFIGVGAAGFIVARSPSFWIGFVKELIFRFGPLVVKFILKRKSPEEEKKWRDEYLRGGRDKGSD